MPPMLLPMLSAPPALVVEVGIAEANVDCTVDETEDSIDDGIDIPSIFFFFLAGG